MILLFTDFGARGPYVGQMLAVLASAAPRVPAVSLMADVPAFRVRGAAYLLAAYLEDVPPGSVLLGVVDPGVGTESRAPVAVRADGRWLVGPGNGLFAIAARRARQAEWRRITWRPGRLSASFHGRDLFAPVAARLALGEDVPAEAMAPDLRADWPEDLPEVIYVDAFGNCMTGIRADTAGPGAEAVVGGARLRCARTFGEVPSGAAFWYRNANGLLELAVNQGSAAATLGLAVGDAVRVVAA